MRKVKTAARKYCTVINIEMVTERGFVRKEAATSIH